MPPTLRARADQVIECGMTPRIDRERLIGRLDAFNRTGALPRGGKRRLAPNDEDRAGCDLLESPAPFT